MKLSYALSIALLQVAPFNTVSSSYALAHPSLGSDVTVGGTDNFSPRSVLESDDASFPKPECAILCQGQQKCGHEHRYRKCIRKTCPAEDLGGALVYREVLCGEHHKIKARDTTVKPDDVPTCAQVCHALNKHCHAFHSDRHFSACMAEKCHEDEWKAARVYREAMCGVHKRNGNYDNDTFNKILEKLLDEITDEVLEVFTGPLMDRYFDMYLEKYRDEHPGKHLDNDVDEDSNDPFDDYHDKFVFDGHLEQHDERDEHDEHDNDILVKREVATINPHPCAVDCYAKHNDCLLPPSYAHYLKCIMTECPGDEVVRARTYRHEMCHDHEYTIDQRDHPQADWEDFVKEPTQDYVDVLENLACAGTCHVMSPDCSSSIRDVTFRNCLETECDMSDKWADEFCGYSCNDWDSVVKGSFN